MKLRRVSIIFVLFGILVVGSCRRDTDDHGSVLLQTSTTQISPQETRATANQVGQEVQRFPKKTGEFLDFVSPTRQPQEMTLGAMPVTHSPTIDGRADEPFWATASAITTLDFSSQRPITLKSVYTTDTVFFLVTYPDHDPSESHKTWVWDPGEEIYREGYNREDVFVFRWSMSGNEVNLALRHAEPHRADIWFWKACQTNPAGYADDKWQSLALEPGKDARKLPSSQYQTLYFRRQGDAGAAAFEEKFFFEYQGDMISKYTPKQPTGSRGDVRAKGEWHNGKWTIEFARQLNTGYDDDISFAPGGVYLFGVAAYAMVFDTPHEKWTQPLYRTGDTFDRLFFRFGLR